MTYHKLVLHFAVVAYSMLTCSLVHAAVVELDAGGPNVTLAGTSFTVSPAAIGTLGGTYRYTPQVAAGTATYAVGSAPGFQPGVQDVYINWGVYNSHSVNGRYTVNHTAGATAFNPINFRLNAAQGSVGALTNGNLTGSGWYYLGAFDLNAASNVVGDHTDAGYFTPDGVRVVPVDMGRNFDELTANVSVTGTWSPTNDYTVPSPSPGLSFASTSSSAATLTYEPLKSGLGLNNPLPVGYYRLELTWAASSTHTTAANYLIDLNGDGDALDAGEATITIDQTKLADQLSNPTSIQWSGWFDAGDFNMTSSSRILLDAGTGITTADLIRLVSLPPPAPEPSSFILLGLGALSLVRQARRRRTGRA